MTHALVWFREDLRVADNSALFSACESSERVSAVYCIDEEAWLSHDMAPCRASFILKNLSALKKNLERYHVPLYIIHVTKTRDFFPKFQRTMEALRISALYFNEQYKVDERRRDNKIAQLCDAMSISVHRFTDQVIFGEGVLLTGKKQPYTVFTPYKKAFLSRMLLEGGIRTLGVPKKVAWQEQQFFDFMTQEIPLDLESFELSPIAACWKIGEAQAHHQLEHFAEEKIYSYEQQRDFPALAGTSSLSPYLATGILSPRQCFLKAIEANEGKFTHGNTSCLIWMAELIWREFYKQILWAFPHVCRSKPFKRETDSIAWSYDKNVFQAWCEGNTGYPLVDAAMRQLHALGWMHNRLRMIVGSFLTKDCFIDWRWGERYFMRTLIDGDFSANNGGWQWVASTGCDSVPYFRVFNPVRQSERFDAEALFIKHWLPELREISPALLHDPFKLPIGLNYPKPIIDYRLTKNRVLQAFKESSFIASSESESI